MKTINLCVLLIAVVFCSCKKNAVKPILLTDATYTGSFNYTNTNPALDYAAISGNVTVTMQNQNYTCTSPTISFPAAARGIFTITDQQFLFRDSTIHTANFDWQIILNGSYNASAKGDSLFLVKKVNTSVYTYKLKKQ